MANGPEEIPQRLIFRVFIDEDGKVYLSFDRLGGKGVEVRQSVSRKPLVDSRRKQIEVHRPVSRKTLEEARTRLESQILNELQEREAELAVAEGGENKRATARREARKEVEDALNGGGLLTRATYVTELIIAILLATIGWIFLSFLAYKGILYSREHLPGPLYSAVLALYALALILGISLIATERARWKRSKWLGPSGLLILPGLILVFAAAVFASFTITLYVQGLVNLEPCRGTPVSEGALFKFYTWHFLKLVPLLNVNDVLKWNEPLCYSQTRVGILILLFQLFVVVPSIATVRFYWTNRHKLSGVTSEYVYEHEWSPGSE